ncbi:hypothetical protein KP509_1Z189500 [Ceratopteris richardii]|nr:hypothetical protein KP509_1Z189500 [Ceratopteris richardii]
MRKPTTTLADNASVQSITFFFFCCFPLILFALVHASPIQIPDLTKCQVASASSASGPPVTLFFTGPIVDFSFEKYKPIRKHIRRPAHTASEEYIAKYMKAYELMRALPDTDPRSLQSYLQAGVNGDIPLQVHFSWFFLPWHRWYLYFHERILASLIGDPRFSLLYWEWDDQVYGGNQIPEMYTRVNTSLYDEKRRVEVQPPTIVPLAASTPANLSASIVINQNLNNMYQSVVTASTATLFMGGALRAGADLSNSTNGLHSAIHYYVGDPRTQLLQNMGNFGTAARDPIFYSHHSNVDRLWEVWRFNMPDGERFDHTDPDFLNAEFVFYDENANMVRVKVSDALDSEMLGVYYKKGRSDNLWINYSPTASTNESAIPVAVAAGVPFVGEEPLNGTITIVTNFSAIVKRPSEKKPSKKLEVLNIQGVQVAREEFVALVAFVNIPWAGESTATNSAEYLGTFNIVPSADKSKHLNVNVKYEIGDNLKRIGINEEDEVVISLVVTGGSTNATLTIQGLKIDYEDQ